MRSKTHQVALGGVLAALAVVIMAMGGLIPVATYVCPMLCSLLLFAVLNLCGRRIAWAWYGAVSVLSLLLGPDKEAAAVFLALGYYPVVKVFLDRVPFGWLLKLVFFNAVTVVLYLALMYLFGMEHLLTEFRELGVIGMGITLILGNVSFFMLDRLLVLITTRIKHRKNR